MKATGSDLRLKGQGIGSVHQFVCARCNHPRPTTGRKFARWRPRRLDQRGNDGR